jgi:hypothetical protein
LAVSRETFLPLYLNVIEHTNTKKFYLKIKNKKKKLKVLKLKGKPNSTNCRVFKK